MKISEANIRQIEKWKEDSWKSVEYYNEWFTSFAPNAFLEARTGSLEKVLLTFSKTNNLQAITIESILQNPRIIEVLRMVTAPPLAQDRLVGLAYAKKSLLKTMESGKTPKTGTTDETRDAIGRMINIVEKMLDRELFPWLSSKKTTFQQRKRSAGIVADRLTGVLSDPIIRNAQEGRQLQAISNYLISKGYSFIEKVDSFTHMPKKCFSFHVNVPIFMGQDKKSICL